MLGERYAVELQRLSEMLAIVRPPVAAWLVFPVPERFWGGSPAADEALPTEAAPTVGVAPTD